MEAQEFIGKQITITKAGNNTLVGVEGEVIDETKETFVLETKNGRKTILKHDITFRVDDKEIDGKTIIARPEDRIKK